MSETALAAGRFPLVYGADCTVLLGAVPALRDAAGQARARLRRRPRRHDLTRFVARWRGGQHGDRPPARAHGPLAPARLRRLVPALEPAALGMLGMRDGAWRQELNVASLAERGVLLHTAEAVAADPAGSGRAAAARAAENSGAWWLHVDVDVLAEDELGSQFVPGDDGTPGGLTWPQLTSALTAALGVDGCRGLSVTIYDPDQDPDGSDARRIVQLVRELAPFLPARSPGVGLSARRFSPAAAAARSAARGWCGRGRHGSPNRPRRAFRRGARAPRRRSPWRRRSSGRRR